MIIAGSGHLKKLVFLHECKETGQNRKGELGLKPLNIKVLCYNLGLQKSPVCPIFV